MSVARATIEVASSKEDRKKAVARAGKVVGPLLVPSRHVVKLLSGLDALFPLCKQVSKTLAVSVSSLAFRSMISHTFYLGRY
jgi:hypothetical protein